MNGAHTIGHVFNDHVSIKDTTFDPYGGILTQDPLWIHSNNPSSELSHVYGPRVCAGD